MKHFGNSNNTEEHPAEINMSPLVDMVFLLLIFFMVTTVFVQETGIEIKRPQASTATSAAKENILIAITKDEDILYTGSKLYLGQVAAVIKHALGERDLPVVILADASVETGLLVKVIDQCKIAGANQVSIAAAKE